MELPNSSLKVPKYCVEVPNVRVAVQEASVVVLRFESGARANQEKPMKRYAKDGTLCLFVIYTVVLF